MCNSFHGTIFLLCKGQMNNSMRILFVERERGRENDYIEGMLHDVSLGRGCNKSQNSEHWDHPRTRHAVCLIPRPKLASNSQWYGEQKNWSGPYSKSEKRTFFFLGGGGTRNNTYQQWLSKLRGWQNAAGMPLYI